MAAKLDNQQDFIFRSKLPDIYIPNQLPLHTYCFENISQFKDNPCLIKGATGDIYTYAEVELTSRKVAAGLNKLGIQQGDVIMLLLQNSPEFVFAFLGASFCFAISTTANPLSPPADIITQLTSSKAKLVITQAVHVDKVKQFAKENDIKVITTDARLKDCLHFSELASSHEKDIPNVKINADDLMVLPYSSGTTGFPKGVMLTHKGSITSVAQLVDGENPNLYIHCHDVILCLLPLFHIYALSLILLCGLRVGAALLIVQKFEISSLMELLTKYKVTVAPFVPPIILAIVKRPVTDKYDLSSIRFMISSAAPMGKELEDAIKAKLPNAILAQGYGMTEAAPAAMSFAFAKEPFKVKSGACGTVLRNSEMKIIDLDTGKPLPRNQAGEICIRGNQIMKGYLNDPEATERIIDKDGWLHTGDVGYIDDDDELFIVDRLKELIKYKGFQVAPAELEALLIAHPHIYDAAVVPMKDDVAGEVPAAFVVRSKGSNITEGEIKQYISKQVIFYKRIKKVILVDAIPKLTSGERRCGHPNSIPSLVSKMG
ncbi:hypothetical protein JCGZ_08680 [Jatropha curcas]|uniref:4-coumarate--CoA ligase n=1 Tax=Jatropha curcas TaxID=180498 RepID=A0A067KJJ9_JATCU|nr:hypothetical protein JCGZ_08680 [Jatropha curcas]